jgi:hypothetical protein
MNGKKRIEPIPEEFNSYEEAAEFWEVHDITDYPDAFQTVEIEDTELRQRFYEVEIAEDIIKILSEQARKRRISVSCLVSDMLRQQIHSVA